MTAVHLLILQNTKVTTTDDVVYNVPSTNASTNDDHSVDDSSEEEEEEEEEESTAGAIVNGQYTGYSTHEQVSPPSASAGQYSANLITATATQVPTFTQFQPPSMTPGMTIPISIISGPPGTPNQTPSSSTPTFHWTPLPLPLPCQRNLALSKTEASRQRRYR